MSEKTLGPQGSRMLKELSLLLPLAVPGSLESPEGTSTFSECLSSTLWFDRQWLDNSGPVTNFVSGTRAYDAIAQFSTFSTILPPNSPMCHSKETERVLHSATSWHTGGVNGSFYDGSVRFIADSINCGNLMSGKIKSNGPSDFGAWGAMGSINGGESDSL